MMKGKDSKILFLNGKDRPKHAEVPPKIPWMVPLLEAQPSTVLPGSAHGHGGSSIACLSTFLPGQIPSDSKACCWN